MSANCSGAHTVFWHFFHLLFVPFSLVYHSLLHDYNAVHKMHQILHAMIESCVFVVVDNTQGGAYIASSVTDEACFFIAINHLLH